MNISEKSMQRHAAHHLPTLKPGTTMEGRSTLSLDDMLSAATDMYSRAVLAGDSKAAMSALNLVVDIRKLLSAEEDLKN